MAQSRLFLAGVLLLVAVLTPLAQTPDDTARINA